MSKAFAIAVAVSIMPLSKKIISPVQINDGITNVPALSYKNTITANFWETGKKESAQSWSQTWLAQAQENIRQKEYNFKWEEAYKAYCTPNRKNNLRFFYNDKGFVVEPRVTRLPVGTFDPLKRPDEIKYRNIPDWKIKFDLDRRQIGKGSWKVVDNKAEFMTEKITVQYINNDEGMRQNFIVHSALSNNAELKINLGVKTKLRTYSDGSRLQFFHKKTNVLNYEGLKVWDASGKALNASFKKNKEHFYIHVETENAVYPITIDPISTVPSAMLEAQQANANFGCSVASAGDINGDGYSDVIVGAYSYNNGQTGEGAAFFFHGSSSGVSATASAMVESNQNNALMGYIVATAGDVNGDGYSDVIVSAPNYTNGQTNEGRAYVYHGSAAGINTTAAAIMESNQLGAFLGNCVASAGDVNADGYSDVIVGAYSYSNGQASEGVAFVYHGSAAGINITPVSMMQSNQANAFLGYSVASAGDVNGDGYSDVIVGAHFYDNGQAEEGGAFVYHGSAAGINTTVAATLECNQVNGHMGYSVASAGDVNGDGYSDVVASAYQYDNGQADEGAAFIYHGSVTGINIIPLATLECNQAGAYMGWFVNCAGDVNGDGYSDVIVCAYQYDNVQNAEGAAFIYQGSPTGINSIATVTLETQQVNALVAGVASAGDVNGDGYSDIIVGSREYDNGQINEGVAFVYHGSAAGLSASPVNSISNANQTNASFGVSVASAGDINGDGFSDVIIGANAYDDGVNNDEGRAFVYHGSAAGLPVTANSTPDDADQANASFGISVSSAGDVNGDGFSDVIIGAFNYDDGVNANEGRVFVYHGSAAGLSASPNSTPDDADQASALFGISVASAGDVNADGYSDVIIGANSYDDGANANEGRAFVYHGSATGLSAAPNSIPDDANQAQVFFGCAVSSAGDVNGDGFSDVIIGANAYDDGVNNDEGRAFVYHGSLTGLSATPDNTPDDANQAGANFGIDVSCAGDVNGDGFSDVIIGAYLYNDGAVTDEGRAFVYHGSATGLSATPDNVPDDANLANAIFGHSVASAGDINGDGYADVIIGASGYDDGANTSEGRAFVYHGSATGLAAAPNSTADFANQGFAAFGVSVAGAGDINGDGYSDLVIGANLYDGGTLNEGGAFVYMGNELTANRRNNLRLYNTDLSTPLNSSNFILGNFGAGLYAKSFLGRSKGKLVWETRLNYTAYSGTPITNSTFFTSQQATYSDLGLSGIEVKNLVTKILGGYYTKLRARIKYDPVTALTGQVYSPWRNVSSIIDANNLGVLPIDLLSFNASWLQKGKTAKLDFTTDKEAGICCFDIEKSGDGSNFYSIGIIPAKNASGIQSYSFIDINAKATNQFYRLKIKGLGGQVQYSNLQQLQNNGATEILVFPNPTTNLLQLQLNEPGNYAAGKIRVTIVNATGQIVKKSDNLSVTNRVLTIPVIDLPAGRYWLYLENGIAKQVIQFVKE
jgi:FG-GAP repeat/Secretion system C-terminal sorting domain/FG-GAP-like repeat